MLELQDNLEQEDSIAYGNELIEDKFPPKRESISAWKKRFWQHIAQKGKYRNTPTVNQEEQDISISNWYRDKNPFTQSDLLDIAEDHVKDLIQWIQTLSSIPYNKRLANRIITLFKDAKEEEPDSTGIMVGSLRNFYNFLCLYPNLSYPIVSLTPDYNIYVSWRSKKPYRVFSIHFLPNGENARFVIFKPNDRHPNQKIRISGGTTTDFLKQTVEPHGIWDWITE